MSKADSNQKEIVNALRSVGASVFITSQVGNGFPDLVVGIFGKNYLIEVKNKKGKNKLEPKQIIFHELWKGNSVIVTNIKEALETIGCKID